MILMNKNQKEKSNRLRNLMIVTTKTQSTKKLIQNKMIKIMRLIKTKRK